jgi:L-threonylcarbamoyladenylate synthase
LPIALHDLIQKEDFIQAEKSEQDPSPSDSARHQFIHEAADMDSLSFPASVRFGTMPELDEPMQTIVRRQFMATEDEIKSAANAIRAGQLVAFPTETVYGLGADALNPIAVAKIFELKGRPRFDPLIVHIAERSQLDGLVQAVPPLAQSLIEKFWPGPLSLVLKKQSLVPDIVTAGLDTVAVRCPQNVIARELIRSAATPIAAPSANRFGMVSPTTAKHVRDQFGDQLQFILDDGPCDVGVESSVISFVESEDGSPVLLRPGGITLEEIESVVGPVQTNLIEESKPTSPGQLLRHYSPRTPLCFTDAAEAREARESQARIGLLCLQHSPLEDPSVGNAAAYPYAAVEVLSEEGCFREAAANLFAAMRRLDEKGLDLIVAEPVAEIELGSAIMDRLRRAAAK